ncbi:MAG: hypothetical protein MPJ24_08205 [Pirellulaceae bacterium]|nr:hypothetical protein [Pirellulaceae bacterium]
MNTPTTNTPKILGFLTVIQDAQQRLFGGYLLLNHLGRPLEFHCTAPVKANRAQEILYGSTIKPFLYGEQIAKTLFEKSKNKVSLVVTDLVDVLPVRLYTQVPVCLTKSSISQDPQTDQEAALENSPEKGLALNTQPEPPPSYRGDLFENKSQNIPPTSTTTSLTFAPSPGKTSVAPTEKQPSQFDHLPSFPIAGNTIYLSPDNLADRQGICQILDELGNDFDLGEPFQRIQEAIEEAQKGV